MWKKVTAAVAILVVGAGGFIVWYLNRHSMGVIECFTIAGPEDASAVLVATQGSDFKNVVVDVSALPSVDESRWDAVVIIHTWEYGNPQSDAAEFIQRVKDPSGVDAISGASVMTEAPDRVAEISARTDRILGREEPAWER